MLQNFADELRRSGQSDFVGYIKKDPFRQLPLFRPAIRPIDLIAADFA